MKSFPDKLRPENRDKFPSYLLNRRLCKLRQLIIDYMYSGDTKGFSLTESLSENSNGYEYGNIYGSEIISVICKELEILGWNTKLAYGNSVLFIFKETSELPIMGDVEEIDV